nr:hypothetical protein Iba_scaffold33101CG0040 [Ipomoea batatas]GME12358.1 hypothetical protein Iba_scaffold13656CG0020 [Ipomoea batatas]
MQWAGENPGKYNGEEAHLRWWRRVKNINRAFGARVSSHSRVVGAPKMEIRRDKGAKLQIL